jgi:hypothetical protein
LTITLSDALEQALAQTAAQSNQTPEDVILQVLIQQLIPTTPSEVDPLMALFGSIQSDYPDLADRHDEYIGQSLINEMYSHD